MLFNHRMTVRTPCECNRPNAVGVEQDTTFVTATQFCMWGCASGVLRRCVKLYFRGTWFCTSTKLKSLQVAPKIYLDTWLCHHLRSPETETFCIAGEYRCGHGKLQWCLNTIYTGLCDVIFVRRSPVVPFARQNGLHRLSFMTVQFLL